MFVTEPQGTAPCIRSGSTFRKRWEEVGSHTESAKGRGGKGGECKDVGGRRAFMLSHRRKRHSFPVTLDDLVAWAWPVDPAEVGGNNTLFRKVRLSRCRARLVP